MSYEVNAVEVSSSQIKPGDLVVINGGGKHVVAKVDMKNQKILIGLCEFNAVLPISDVQKCYREVKLSTN